MIYILPTDTCFGIACGLSEIKDYNKIYKIKKRSYDKPFAVLVEDFKWLKANTELTTEQIDFLKDYKKPFTILTESRNISIFINYVDLDNNLEFINRDMYEKIAFRIVNNDTEKRLIKENGPMFLTSANISNDPEMYNSKEVETVFEYYLEKGTIEFVGKNVGKLPNNGVSDIFEFKGESLEVNYLRN